MERYESRAGPGGRTGRARALPRAGAARALHVQQEHRLHAGGARGLRTPRAATERRQHDGPAGPARVRQHRAQDGRARALHRPGRPARPQRDPVLPRPVRPHRGVHAHRLHADGGPRLPGVQPHLPARPRALDHARASRPRARGAVERAVRRRAAHRGHRQREHPGPGRPGRGRHGHPRGQARALHGRRRHPSVADAADQPRRGHRQPGRCWTTTSISAGAIRACGARRTTSWWTSSWRARARCSRGC